MHDCEPPDPGEAYFEAATERIMALIGEPALQGRSVEESRTLGSMRYGPLAIRGVGPGFVVAVGLLAAALFGPSPAPVLAGPNPLVGNPRLTPVPALAGADVGVAAARGDVGRYDVIAAGDRLHRALAHRRMEMTVAKRVVVPNEVHLSPPETPPSQK